MEKTIEQLNEEIDDLNAEILSLKGEISDLESDLSEVDNNDDEIEELESQVATLESELEAIKGCAYIICGEQVLIQCDDIQYQTFFEMLAEQSNKYNSVNDLFAAITNRL